MPLTVAKAAETTGIPKRTIRDAIERRQLKADKLDGRTGAYIIDEADFQRWTQQRP